MSSFSSNKWKYSTIGLLAVLAVGFSFPQAFAHTTNSMQHILGHIFDNTELIKARTDNLPADPASQSALDIQLSSIQADADDIQAKINSMSAPAGTNSVTTNVSLNPADGESVKVQIIAPEEGKVFHGHISGEIVFPAGNAGFFTCVIAPGQGVSLVPGPPSGLVFVNQDFACLELYASVTDIPSDGTDVDGGSVNAITVYSETLDVAVVPAP